MPFRDDADYWKYGCSFQENTTRSEMLIQSSPTATSEQPGAGEITLSAWGGDALSVSGALPYSSTKDEIRR